MSSEILQTTNPAEVELQVQQTNDQIARMGATIMSAAMENGGGGSGLVTGQLDNLKLEGDKMGEDRVSLRKMTGNGFGSEPGAEQFSLDIGEGSHSRRTVIHAGDSMTSSKKGDRGFDISRTGMKDSRAGIAGYTPNNQPGEPVTYRDETRAFSVQEARDQAAKALNHLRVQGKDKAA